MPTLEIRADNIVCSHGASVADLDENSMFYLSARGVNRQEARKLLLRGFVFDLLVGSIMVSEYPRAWTSPSHTVSYIVVLLRRTRPRRGVW